MTKIQPPKQIIGKNYIEVSLVEAPVVPTQVAHPWKAVIRTAIQTGLPAVVLGALIAILEASQDFITDLSPNSPWGVYIGMAVTGVTGFSVMLARIMANPQVNDLLTRFGLGAEPKNGETIIELPIQENNSEGVG